MATITEEEGQGIKVKEGKEERARPCSSLAMAWRWATLCRCKDGERGERGRAGLVGQLACLAFLGELGQIANDQGKDLEIEIQFQN
jgi:hypothetical protein